MNTVLLTCPGCGFPVEVGAKECPAGHPINISTFNNVYDMPLPLVNKYATKYKKDLLENPDDTDTNYSIGICFLKLKLYDKALSAFEKAMVDNFDNSEVFLYSSICLLQGKKPFLHQRPTINRIVEFMEAAIMIEPKGIYYYFLAYIKYDYFERKFLNTKQNYKECMELAKQSGLSNYDVEQLYAILGVEKPDIL